jgi:hypothetical protein
MSPFAVEATDIRQQLGGRANDILQWVVYTEHKCRAELTSASVSAAILCLCFQTVCLFTTLPLHVGQGQLPRCISQDGDDKF